MMLELLKRIPGARKLAQVIGVSPKNYRMFLLKMLPPNSVGAEIGVHLGDFSEEILQEVSPRELWLIDPWVFEPSETYKDSLYGARIQRGQEELDERYDSVHARFHQQIENSQVRILRGYSSDMLAEFEPNYFDWVYIDGNHLFEFAKQDLRLSYEKTKVGGLITGDDYAEGGWFQGGVKQAVDEFVKKKPVTLLKVQHRQFVLRKDA